MKNKTKVQEFLNSLSTEVDMGLVNVDDIDCNNAYESIYQKIQDSQGFDIEIIYYSSAIEYLHRNDPSLNESLRIADELGYEIKNLNSELLASLLASQNARYEFHELRNEIDEFFKSLKEEEDDDDDEA